MLSRENAITRHRCNTASRGKFSPCGSGRISGQIGKACRRVVRLNGFRWETKPMSQAVPERRRVLRALGLSTVLLSAVAAAQQNPEAPPLSLPTVEVVGATPLLGSGVDRD